MKKFLVVAVSLFLIGLLTYPCLAASRNPTWDAAMDYYWGQNGKKRDYKAALGYLTSVGDYAGPNFFIGEIYQYGGYGVEKDTAKAVRYYKKALPQSKTSAGQGNTWPMFCVGYMYQMGLGTEPNQEEALKWLREGAAKNDNECMYRLGITYYDGIGVARDYKESAKWFKASIKRPDSRGYGYAAEAEEYIGHIYRDGGNGVEQDYADAMRWYEKAAGKNRPVAMCNVGELYEKGNGVPADKEKAIEWYKKSLAGGHDHAKEGLERLGVK